LNGTIDPSSYKLTSNGALYLTASYVDKGANGVPSITGSGNAILRNPLLQATSAKASPGISNSKVNDYQFKMINSDQAWIEFPNISLQDVNNIKINYGLAQASQKGWKVEVHLDDPQGKLLGETTIGADVKPRKPASAQLRLQQEAGNGLHDVYFVFEKNSTGEQGGLAVSSMLLETR
jgi:cytochrome c